MAITSASQNVASPDTCAIPLIPDVTNGMSGVVVDCATVHVAGQGIGTMADDAATRVSSPALTDHGSLSSEVVGTCAGCDTPFGSGAGYRAFIRLQDAASGEFISVGLIHDNGPIATGDDTTGLTLMVETGRKVANTLDVQCGYLSASTNRVPNGRATLHLSWTPQGVDVTLDGLVPPGETAPRLLTLGTYAVSLVHPVASFGATAKGVGDRVDTTFTAITAS